MSERGHLVPPLWLEAHGITADEMQRWAAEFERQSRTGRVKLLTPLPRRTKYRLWLTRRIDVAACWLVEHVSPRAGRALWRAFGVWR